MSTLKVNTISEQTAANGVSVDGVLVKDGGLQITGFDFYPHPTQAHPTLRPAAAGASRLYLIPNGDPGVGLHAGMKMFNTDYVADTTNYGDFGMWAGSDYNYINSKKNGTGTRRDIAFAWDDTHIVGFFKLADGTGYLGLGEGNVAPTCQLDVENTTPATNTAVQTLRLAVNSTGTPAAGFGTGLAMFADTNGAEDRYLVRMLSTWTDATDATRKAKFSFYIFDTVQREVLTLAGLGAAPGIGFFGAAPVARPAGVAVTAEAIHAALVSLGLIAA
jgi:hypothetical protein